MTGLRSFTTKLEYPIANSTEIKTLLDLAPVPLIPGGNPLKFVVPVEPGGSKLSYLVQGVIYDGTRIIREGNCLCVRDKDSFDARGEYSDLIAGPSFSSFPEYAVLISDNGSSLIFTVTPNDLSVTWTLRIKTERLD